VVDRKVVTQIGEDPPESNIYLQAAADPEGNLSEKLVSIDSH